MDYRRFVAELPRLYHDWGKGVEKPIDSRFEAALSRLRGMTSAGVLQLLNFAVQLRDENEAYLEVGCYQGATLIGALLDQPSCQGYAVDNFSQFDPDGRNQSILLQNLQEFGMQERVSFFSGQFEEFLLQLRLRQIRIGVYLYDGAHDYRSQLMGLLLCVPLLAPRALIVVDDSNYPAVKQATWDFAATHPQCQVLIDIGTPGNCHPSFWNGVQVLGWDRNIQNQYDWSQLQAARQADVLETFDLLQHLKLKRKGDQIHVSRAM